MSPISRFGARLCAALCLFFGVSSMGAEQTGQAAGFGVVRPAALAGTWYPADPKVLASTVDGLLAQAPKSQSGPDEQVDALVVPHAGMVYAGRTAAAAFKLVQGHKYARVIVLGPSHRMSFSGLAVPPVDAFETPLGKIPLDLQALAELRQSPLVSVVPGAHAQEHSIEMELPYLQRALQPGWKLVPILVGQMSEADYATAAQLLRPLDDKDTLVVVSSDFTHYGPRFDYLPFAAGEGIAGRLRNLDMGLFEQMSAFNPKGLLAYKERTGITACGFGPIMVLTELLKGEASPRVIDYSTSGQLTGSYENSVSYLGVGYFEKDPPGAAAYTPQELRTLHGLALRALKLAVDQGASAVDPDALVKDMNLPDKLKAPGAAFVTLRQEAGDLRGCIGDIIPYRPLYESIIGNAVSAALRDPRFTPVRPGELKGLEVEISLLTPPRPIPSYKDYNVAHQGVILHAEGRHAVYLPEVAPSMGWSREHTLSQLSLKAGLDADAWKSPDARFEVFTSVTYEAPYAQDASHVVKVH